LKAQEQVTFGNTMRRYVRSKMSDAATRSMLINLVLVAAVATGGALAYAVGSSSYGVKMLPANEVNAMYATVSLPTT
jgi:hypothetical protein